jgi:fatty acid desaturase
MSVADVIRPAEADAAFIRQAKHLVHDLMAHRPAFYWADFLITIAVAYASLCVYLTAPNGSLARIGCFVVAGLALYRASVFTHELSHLPPSRFRLFRVVWNVLFGVPFLMPSFLYTDHRAHHMNQTYGTFAGDSEYYPYGRTPPLKLLLMALGLFVIPLLPLFRFGLLGPLSLLHPRLRRLVWQRASSLGTMNPNYRRADPDADERRSAPLQEAGAFVAVATLFTLLLTGVMPWVVFGQLYLLYLFIEVVNMLRVFGAHRYVSPGDPMPFLDQMLDTTTIPGGPWSELWAPLGMRYHALHHLFPTMPYHAMGEAHRRLMRELPPDSPYHATLVPSLPAAIWHVIRAARLNAAQ